MKIGMSSETEAELSADFLFDDPSQPLDGIGLLRHKHARELLAELHTLDGPDLHAWYHHFGILHFSAEEHGCCLAEVELLPSCYRIAFPLPRELRRGVVSRSWYHGEESESADFDRAVGIANDAAQAARIVLEAIAASGNNPNRIGAKWQWYICPKCDLHAPQYPRRCERCGYEFPSERKSQLIGLYRTAGEPQGCTAPRNPTS